MIAGLAERTSDRIDVRQKDIIRIEATVERLINKCRFLLLVGACLLYLVPTIELARRKLIWTDEFFTLYLSRLNARQLWAALLAGGDQHPPGFYLLHHMFLRSFGENPWVLRLPAILGFLLMMVCVFQFVAKRTSVAYGLVAMLIPLATGAHEFAYEARGYSLVLGFTAVAVLGWQGAGERRGRTAAAVVVALGLTGGVLSHYYAILLIPAIAAAEIVRSLRRKTWNLAVWLAMCIPIIPLAAFFPLLKSSSSFAATFWGKASLNGIQLYYENILGSGITCLLFCFALAALYRMVCYEGGDPTPISSKTFPVEEIVLGLALAGAPVIAYLFGKWITGVFVWRYAIGGVLGLAILFGFFCFKLLRGSAIAAGLIAIVIAASFAITARTNMHTLAGRQASLKDLIAWLAGTGNGSEPLIIADSQSFYTLSYYSPLAMKERYIYLVDPQRSLKYLGHDTPDRSLSVLRQWFGLNVKDYRPYVESHRNMKVWIPPNPNWIWVLSALIDDGRKLTVVGRLGTSILYSASAGDDWKEH
jgi:hypothetical protein